jgi:hypothetical protein
MGANLFGTSRSIEEKHFHIFYVLKILNCFEPTVVTDVRRFLKV